MNDSKSGTGELISAVAELSRTATGQFTINELLRHLVDLAAQHLTADGAGVMVADGAELLFVHGSTTGVDRVERLQELMQQGPCQEAMRQLRPVAVADLGDFELPNEWDSYRDGAELAGLQSVVAVPLVSRGRG